MPRRALFATRREPLDVGGQLAVEESLTIATADLDQGPSGKWDLGALEEQVKR